MKPFMVISFPKIFSSSFEGLGNFVFESTSRVFNVSQPTSLLKAVAEIRRASKHIIIFIKPHYFFLRIQLSECQCSLKKLYCFTYYCLLNLFTLIFLATFYFRSAPRHIQGNNKKRLSENELSFIIILWKTSKSY